MSLNTAARPIAFALCALALLGAQSVPARAQQEPRVANLDMVGRGTVTAAPDMATVTSGVVTDRDTAAEAMAANSEAMTAIVDAIKAAGIEPRDIQTSGFSVAPRYAGYDSSSGNNAARIIGYRVTNNVTVKVRDLTGLGTLLDAMVGTGANAVGGIGFIVSEAETLKDEARRAAMADARRKAELYAEAAGVQLGRILSISEQVGYQPKAMMVRNFAAAEAASAPVEAGEESLEVQVNVTWELQQ